jgi:hypothetical protein
MLNAIFRPVEAWPDKQTPRYNQRRGPFKAPYPKTLDLLETELTHLRAKDVIIQAYFSRDDIRNDGWPKSSARPSRSGVIVQFYVGTAVYSYPCDTFAEWQDNLRAIALSLEALRAVNRYGVTKGSEQYQGFRRLEAPTAVSPTTLAEQFIATQAGVRIDDVRADLEGAYRAAARKLHPDLNKSGSHDLFVELQTHYKALKETPVGVS